MTNSNNNPPEPDAKGPDDEVHRPPTASERLRKRIEGLPRVRFYVVLVVVTWALLTFLIGLGSNPLVALGLRDAAGGYEVGAVADEDVFAPRNVTYEDPVATREAREEAAAGAEEVYRLDPAVPGQASEGVEEFFAEVRDVRSSDAPNEEKVRRIADASPAFLPDNSARDLAFLENGEVDEVERYVQENLDELYASTAVADDELGDVPAAVVPLSEARTQLSEAADRDASGEVGALVDLLGRQFVQPNYVVDREATQRAAEAAAGEVEPVMGTIRQGERILARGEIVDEQDVAQLEALSVIPDANPWTAFLGVGIVVAAEMGIAWYFMERFGRRLFKANAVFKILLAASLTVLFTALARLFIMLSVNPYLTPLAGLSIIGTLLLGPRLMFLMVVITSVNVGIIAGNDFFLMQALLLSSGFAIYTAIRATSRTRLLKAGIVVAAVTAVVMFAGALIGGSDLSAALVQGVRGLANGLLSLMIAMVLLPFLENAFNILTPMKLLELSDPGRPLLQKLLRKAPGTFSHSMMVGNLAESAAERIGADALLARVGAYYHDVGKMEHPGYYIENQISKTNPHNNLTPALSARIIKRHTKDGVEIGRTWELPQEILDITAEHHGTTRIEYFYRKALEEAPEGATVRESDFRYPGGKPRSKESGIVMVADSVEATVKSLSKPTPKRIEDVIDDTIKNKLDDGQFDECALTLREIHAIGEAIRGSLIGFLGPRIEYPEDPKKKPAEKPRAASASGPGVKAT